MLPGGATALAVAGLLQLGGLRPLEQIFYNVLFQLRGSTSWDNRVVLVTIDEASLKQLGRFPWARQHYVALLDQLAEARASVVVLNLILSESSPDDQALADAMKRQGQVVLAQGEDSAGVPLLPNPTLAKAAIAQGHALKQEDVDGITRAIAPQIREVPTLGLVAAQTYALVREPVVLPNLSHPLLINWSGPVEQIPEYSFVDVIQGKIPTVAFQNKIILVGITAAGFDPLPTPFNRNPSASGVYLHATLAHNLLQQNLLRTYSNHWLLLLLLLSGPGFSFALTRWSAGQQLIVWVGLCSGWVVLSLLLFELNYLLPVASPIMLLTLTAAAVTLSERLRVNFMLQQQVKKLWQAHHQDLVMQTVHPSSDTTTIPKSQQQFSLKRPVSMQRVDQLAAVAEQFGRSQSTQAAIARSLTIGLLAADLDGTVWFCNPVAAKWLEVQVSDRLVNHLVPQWLSEEEWQTDLQTLTQTGKVSPRELYHHQQWFELKLEPLLQSSVENGAATFKELNGLLLVLENVTLRKQVEENLNQQARDLQRMNLLKDEFLSTVSHELRTPMSNIKMAIHMLKMASSQEQQERYLQILQNECTREIELINDLLDLQRLEAGAKPLTSENINLQVWLPQVVKPFHERAEFRQQSLQTQVCPELVPLISDPPSLERVLAELINNACKYTPPGGNIVVAACPLAHEGSEPRIELTVTNSGSEIPEAERTRIFEKFYRIPRNDPWKQGGTGLGLALVKKLVDYLGGTIQVESTFGKTMFIVQLPVDQAKAST